MGPQISISTEIPGLAYDHLQYAALKTEYVNCLTNLSAATANLRPVITCLAERGVTRATLLRWATEAGYSTGYVRSLLTAVLREVFHTRMRKPGAGRPVSQDALALLAFARSQYGEKAAKVLRAAYRAAMRSEERRV